MYADDTLLSTASELTLEVLSWINQDLINTTNWLLANKLSLHVTKPDYMLFCTSFKLSNLGVTILITPRDKN